MKVNTRRVLADGSMAGVAVQRALVKEDVERV
jgi:hypothetical protein